MPQFSLTRLFMSVTLIAVGVGFLIWFRESLPNPYLEHVGRPQSPWYSYFLLPLGCACITFAILSLARKA
jgi:hypothetical protein